MKTFQYWGMAMSATLAVALAAGCAVDTGNEAPNETGSSALPNEAALASVGASAETHSTLGVASFDVHKLQAGELRIYALGDDRGVRAVFDVTRLDENGAIAVNLDRTKSIKYDLQFPSKGTRVVEPGSDNIVENNLESGSAGAAMVEAFSTDIANVAPGTTLQSTASLDPQYLACMTDTKCYGVVLWCKDKCCNAYDEIRRQWVECTTMSQYPCGACLGFPW
jgi:hypothetical protein